MSSSSFLPPSIPPVIADRYRLDARLGSGGMGDVFRAHDRILKRDVALKVLREEDAATAPAPNPEVEEDTARRKDPFRQLLREARLCAALQHPNIVTIFDVGVSDGVAFIAMELVEGNNLRVSAANPGATVEEKLTWLRDVANALEAAHNVGLVHRDIKPENVIVKKDGNVKVLDFGIAKWAAAARPIGHATASATTGPVFAGTPGYMPPEQRMGQIDERSDQYAWGVLAFEILSGTRAPRDRPLSSADIEQVLSSEMATLVERATSYRAEERFPSVRALLDVLPAIATTRATIRPARKASEDATKTWAPPKTKKSGGGRERKSARVFVTATLLTVVGVGIAGVALYRYRLRANNTQQTSSPSSSISPPPPINMIDAGLSDDDLAIAPPAPSSSSSSSNAPHAITAPARPPPIFLARVNGSRDSGQRTITLAGFGIGGFTNAQAHRACEKHKDALQRCISNDPEGAKLFDTIRGYAIYTGTGAVGARGIQWHPREWTGGPQLAGCVGKEIDGKLILAEAGEPERGWSSTKNTEIKNAVGCEISATPKAPSQAAPSEGGPQPIISVRITVAADASSPAPVTTSSTTPWPSHEIAKGQKVARVRMRSMIAASYLTPDELQRWGKVVGPRMVPCFNLPRGDCNADLALLDFTGSIEHVSRLRGLNRVGPTTDMACFYPQEVLNCVKSAAGSDPLQVKGDMLSQYTVELHLSP